MKNTLVMAKGEMGFLKVIVKPQWEIMNKFLENKLKQAIRSLDANILKWNAVYLLNLDKE